MFESRALVPASRWILAALSLAVVLLPALNGSAGHAGLLVWDAPGGAVANSYTLRLNGATLELSDDVTGVLLARRSLANTKGVVINGADGAIDDTLTVDFAGGMFSLREGIRYDGGRAGFDALVTKNGFVNSGSHRIVNEHSGILKLGELAIVYSNLEPITDTIPSGNFTIDGTDGADTITLDNGTVTGDGILRVTVNANEPIQFSNKTQVVVNGGLTAADLDDTIIVDFTEAAAGLTFLQINGDDSGSTATAGDNLSVRATAAGVVTQVNGGGGNDGLAVGSAANSLDAILGTVAFNGNAGTDVLFVNDQGDGTTNTYSVSSGGFTRTGSANILFTTLEGVQLNAGTNDDSINVIQTPSAALQIVAGGGNDSIGLADGVTLNAPVDGGAGTDTLDYSLYTSSVIVNLGANAPSFLASLDGGQEVAPNATPASGNATLTYNPFAKTLDINLTVTGITPAEVTGFHIHLAPYGVNGPIHVDLAPMAALVPVGGGFTFNATGVSLPSADEAAFLGGFMYINIHTPTNPGGLIRGQIFASGLFVAGVSPATGTTGVFQIENVNGGSAADSLVGDLNGNALNGNQGNDTIVGVRGIDTVNGGADNDSIAWSNGDDPDVMDGGAGTDTVQVDGALGADDTFTVGAGTGGRLDFDRISPGPFSLDVGTVETLRVVGVSGNDTFTVNDLAGVTDVTNIHLFGDSGDDTFNVTPASNQTMNVDGGIPIPPAIPGDTLIVNLAGTTTPALSSTTTATGLQGAYTFGNRSPVNFAEIESLATAPDLVVTKVGSPNPVFAGDDITYTITLTNSGALDASSVDLRDAIPVGTTVFSWFQASGPVATQVGFDVGTQTYFATWTTFPAGATATMTYIVTVNSNVAQGSAITNTATATTTSSESDTTNNSSTTNTEVVTSADLAVTKTDSPDPVNGGSNITYTIALTNNGPSDAQSVSLTDVIPANTTFVSMTAPAGWTVTTPPVGGTGTVTASRPTLAASVSDNFTLVVNVNPGTPNGTVISNTATAVTTTVDPNPANDSDTETTSTVAEVDLAVTKTDAPDPVAAGSNITYTIMVTNNGPSPAQSVTLTDAVPGSTTFVSMTSPAGWTTTTPPVGGTGTVTATNPTLASAATATFTLVVNVNAATANGSTITNTATVSSTTTEVAPANNSVTATTTVNNAADLAVTKSDSPDPVTAGSNISYTIVMTNNGPLTAQNVTLTDVVPGNTTFVSLTAPAGWTGTTPPVGGTGTVTATNPALAVSASATFTLVVNVNAATANGTTITNTATASSITPDVIAGNNSATATTTVNNAADLAVTKGDSPDPVTPGTNITYTIVVTNNGPLTALNISLSDVVPANTTFVSMTAPAGWTTTTPAVGGTGPVTSTNPALAVSASATFTLVVQVNGATPNGTTITNTATVTSSNDTIVANNSATVTTTAGAVGNIPTLSSLLLAALAAMLAALALLKMKS